MKRICNYANVTSINVKLLEESNKELGLERAQLRFQFVGGSGKGASALISGVDTSNGGSKLIDLTSIEEKTIEKKANKLLQQFKDLAMSSKEDIAEELGCDVTDLTDEDVKSFRYPKFTQYTFTISELTDGKEEIVNNGERNYSTMSTVYLNEHNDKDEAKRVVIDQLQKRIDDGDYEFGKLND